MFESKHLKESRGSTKLLPFLSGEEAISQL
jgi:hypothetical protein